MKAHRSLSRLDIVRQGPSRIALMIASEFTRAANRATNRENVLACYARARELMGILETLALPRAVGGRLKPLFERLVEREILQEKRLQPAFVQRVNRELADEFQKASQQIH